MGLPAEAGLRFVLVFFWGPFSLPFLFGGVWCFFGISMGRTVYLLTFAIKINQMYIGK